MPDRLPGTDLLMDQREGFYHFNSDTELLGQFMKIRHRDSVLDIGCGSGALLLYASLHEPRELYGIDLYPEVLEQAEHNLGLNGREAVLICGRVQEYRGKQFDVIVSNPPYFATENDGLKSDGEYIRSARHEEYLTLEELYDAVKHLLKPKGRFFMVHRAERLNDIMRTAHGHGMSVKTLCPVYRRQGGIRCILLETVHGSRTECRIEAPVYR